MLEGPSAEKLCNELAPAYDSIFQMWDQAPQTRVRHMTAWVISLITRFVPQLVLNSPHTLNLLMQTGLTHIQ